MATEGPCVTGKDAINGSPQRSRQIPRHAQQVTFFPTSAHWPGVALPSCPAQLLAELHLPPAFPEPQALPLPCPKQLAWNTLVLFYVGLACSTH